MQKTLCNLSVGAPVCNSKLIKKCVKPHKTKELLLIKYVYKLSYFLCILILYIQYIFISIYLFVTIHPIIIVQMFIRLVFRSFLSYPKIWERISGSIKTLKFDEQYILQEFLCTRVAVWPPFLIRNSKFRTGKSKANLPYLYIQFQTLITTAPT